MDNSVFAAVVMVSIVPLIFLWVETMWVVEERGEEQRNRGCQ